MFWPTSYFIWSFLCFLTLDQIPGISSGVNCPPGHKATQTRSSCEPCPTGQYNPQYTTNKMCRNCEPCGPYSVEVSACSPESNTKCRCLEGFTALDEAQKRCKCQLGRGIKELEKGVKTCEECRHNSFTDKINSVCQPRPRCVQSSEKMPGNATSDINCRNVKTVVPLSSPLPLTQASSSTTTMTPTRSRNSVSINTTAIPEAQDSRKHALWLASLAVLLLLILILKLSWFCKKKANIVRQGSECGKPIEESGEKFLPPI